ncbi:MAG: ribbon-helix-helix domain-containing protein [Candidatus Hodarchaeales archaeon]|jgi:Arc/MetJ-type ribon-helix-helix transcriptional regulator
MISIPVKLDEELVKKIDLLVKIGVYKTRSEVLRDLITKGIDKIQILEETQVNKKKIKNLLSIVIQNEKEPLNILRTEKSVAEFVSEGRER